MGLPQIIVEFQNKANNAIKRSERGIVALILRDDTVTDPSETDVLSVLTSDEQIDFTKWTPKNVEYIKLAFLGAPLKVMILRIPTAEEGLDAALLKLRDLRWNWLAVPGIIEAEKIALSAWIKEQREEKHKTFKAVLPSFTANHEGIVNFTTDGLSVMLETGVIEYNTAEYCTRIAGMLAGLSLSYSCTYLILEDIVSADVPSDPNERIDAGELVLIFDVDAYRIGRGVNSLTSVSSDKGEDLKKIKIVEGMDLYQDDIRETFKNEYVGQVINDYDNKQAFVAAINDYNRALQGDVLDASFDNLATISLSGQKAWLEAHGENTDDMSDEQILQANTGSEVFVAAAVKFVDAMEDLFMTVEM